MFEQCQEPGELALDSIELTGRAPAPAQTGTSHAVWNALERLLIAWGHWLDGRTSRDSEREDEDEEARQGSRVLDRCR
jgi:hypothetical protein